MTWLADEAVARLRKIADEPDFSGTRYRLQREIARGGMGVVYEAEDLELHRRVAIKVLATPEALVIAKLEHPGIVPVHDAGTLPDGRVFYVMKLVRGRTLEATDHLRLFLRVCEAVAFAHARGVIHCDLKPSNVMIGEFGEVLVMDWGVARATGLAATGGTHGFMPPEQERGEALDATADVFALGCILRMMSPNPPRRLRAIIEKSTSNDRYPTARELADDVAHFIDGEPVSAHHENAIERAGRWLDRNRAVVALILGYLVMRVFVLLIAHR